MRSFIVLLSLCFLGTLDGAMVAAEKLTNKENGIIKILAVLTRHHTNKSNPSDVQIAWPDIVRLVDRHPLVMAGKGKKAAARAAVVAAGAVPNPELEVETAYGRAHDNSESRVEWGLALSIPLGWIAHRGAKINAAEAKVKMADAESQAIRRKVLLRMQSLFWNVVLEQERVKVLSKLAQETTTMIKTIKKKVERDESRPIESVKVEIEAEKIMGRLSTAKTTLKMRRKLLKLRLGIQRKRKLIVIANPEKLPKIKVDIDTDGSLLSTHPAVIAAQQRVRALQFKVIKERREIVPGISLKVFANHELDRGAYGLAVSVELPFWNFNSGRIRKAESLLAAEREKLGSEKMKIESAALDAGAACRAGVDLAIRYRDRIGPRVEFIVRTYNKAYKHGEATLLEMLDARRTLLKMRMNSLKTFIAAQIQCGRFAAFLGKEQP